MVRLSLKSLANGEDSIRMAIAAPFHSSSFNMAPSTVMTQAKQGNPNAIATLLNQALQPKGITATAQLEGNCLTIELSSAHPITQSSTVAFIKQGLNRLQPRRIHTVFVCTQIGQADEFAWMETFDLEGMAHRSTATVPAEPSPEPLSSATLQPNPRETAIAPPAPSHQPRTPRHPSDPATAHKRQTGGIPVKGVEALLIGLVAAIVLFRVQFLKVLFNGSVILVHEVGHAVTHWAFGRPAIPTVNILFGGGITISGGQIWFLNVLIYLGIGYFIYRLREQPHHQGVAVLLTLVYTYCLFTRTNQMLAVFMGHGMELIAIAVCLYLSASGRLCRIRGDRAIYGMLGFFIFLVRIEFYWQLLHNAEFREWYEGGIGGLIDNDLVILANEYFQVDLSRIAGVLLGACLLAPAIGLLAGFVLRPQTPMKDA